MSDFTSVSNPEHYSRLPDDWLIVAADVQNSTAAINGGKYKAVNISGVSVITSIRNAIKPLEVPYIFGGDGATLCIPVTYRETVENSLIATRQMTREQFGLELRVGVVPVEVVREAGLDVLVARHRLSNQYIHAAFAGGGVEYAEALIKDIEKGISYRLESDNLSMADYSGLECRWDQVRSQHGETIAVIVKVLAPKSEQEARIYYEIIRKINRIYGDDHLCKPVYLNGLHFAWSNWKLGHELKVRTFKRGIKASIKHWLLIRIQNLLGYIFMKYEMTTGGIPWGNYKKDLVSNIDFKKFDGTLREVISGTPQQRLQLQEYLEQLHQEGLCVYGIHKSDSALITCMIDNRAGEHYHFVDAADGGYAAAATGLKQQLKKLSAR